MFIAHDLAVVKNVSDRVVVMYLGKICEVGTPDALYTAAVAPVHRRAARRDPDPGPEPAARGPAAPRRRDPVAGRAAERLPVPHPLPEGAGACASEEPEIREISDGPVRRVPLPAERGRDAADAERAERHRLNVAPARADHDAAAAPGLAYHPALDGLRAIAVVAVVAYHFGWIRGGFLGVDLFFVLSGFLITSLLVGERSAHGRIDLVGFWARRARRLASCAARC